MPRTSERATLLEQLHRTFRIRTITRAVRAVECDSEDESSFEDAVDAAIAVLLAKNS